MPKPVYRKKAVAKKESVGQRPALKYHGGKHYLAPRIIAMMPPHTHYVEPFFGGGAVLFAKDPRDTSEVANDVNGELMTFWRVLQSKEQFAQFRRIVEAVPFSQVEWEEAATGGASPVERAVRFFVRCRQSRAGQMRDFATLSRSRTRRGMNEQASAWMTTVEGLPAVAARLKRVVILNCDAVKVIQREDSPKTLFYCDPPYLHETRASKSVYEYEMSQTDHCRLLTALNEIRGAVLLSGYRSELYDSLLPKWSRTEFDLPNNAAGGATKRRMVECVWQKKVG